MRIAFYAPLKSPDHPVPSGDRQMARLLVRTLGLAGHEVEIASHLRSFLREPSEAEYAAVEAEARDEIARLRQAWAADGAPDLWFSYHPYYKAPDLMGPVLAAEFAIPTVTAEASWSTRRGVGAWSRAQGQVANAVSGAALNICFTRRDYDGLLELSRGARLAMLPPFIDVSLYAAPASGATPPRLVTVAMMRPGDKLASYAMLAAALALCRDHAWTLAVIGDGPCRDEVHAAFAGLADRVEWLGERRPEEVPALLAGCDLFVWPGCGEAYGLAYLEAQAAGLPMVAQDTAGVPEVVRDGVTGLLTPAGDVAAFAGAVAMLLGDAALRANMAAEARRFVLGERSVEQAAERLKALLAGIAT